MMNVEHTLAAYACIHRPQTYNLARFIRKHTHTHTHTHTQYKQTHTHTHAHTHTQTYRHSLTHAHCTPLTTNTGGRMESRTAR